MAVAISTIPLRRVFRLLRFARNDIPMFFIMTEY